MSNPTPEPSISQLSAKIDDMVLGLKWLFSLILIVISIPNFFASLAIHHFAEIFHDALPGETLPTLTVTVISHPTLLHLLALTWPVIGILNILYSKSLRNWAIGTAFIVFFIGLQLCLTQTALFMPLTNLLRGMSDLGGK